MISNIYIPWSLPEIRTRNVQITCKNCSKFAHVRLVQCHFNLRNFTPKAFSKNFFPMVFLRNFILMALLRNVIPMLLPWTLYPNGIFKKLYHSALAPFYHIRSRERAKYATVSHSKIVYCTAKSRFHRFSGRRTEKDKF